MNISRVLTVGIATVAALASAASLPIPTDAAPTVGLIKASGPAVYYSAENGKRYVFPTERTFASWYADFSGLQVVSDTELASYPLGGNVTYRPGVRMVKLMTDPKVYAVDRGGTLRWVASESVAAALYGPNWNQQIDDLSDAFFVNYRVGAAITSPADFNPSGARAAAPTISVDLGLTAMTTPVVQVVTVEADDQGLYPSSVVVMSGTPVRLTFKVRSTGVYSGGLTFRSALFSDVQAPPGGIAVVEFTPQIKMIYSLSSYWPASNVLKATGSIVVQ